MKSSVRNTLSNQQAQEKPETVNLTELEEISEESEHFPPQIKVQLLQNAVRPINDLRIVETLDEFQSITTGYGGSSSLKIPNIL